MKTAKTPKGTELPLLNLKGKDYLQVAHRLVWLNEDCPKFVIDTEYLVITDEQTVCRAKVSIIDEQGRIVKQATATKRETFKHFPDHTEKCESGAIGRALAMLGFGTQFTLPDLDEGERIVDSPTMTVKKKGPARPVDDF